MELVAVAIEVNRGQHQLDAAVSPLPGRVHLRLENAQLLGDVPNHGSPHPTDGEISLTHLVATAVQLFVCSPVRALVIAPRSPERANLAVEVARPLGCRLRRGKLRRGALKSGSCAKNLYAK